MSRSSRFFICGLMVLILVGCAPAAPTAPTVAPTAPAIPTQAKPESTATKPPVANDRPVEVKLLQSKKPRVDLKDQQPSDDLKALVAGQNQFALDLYRAVRAGKPEENLFTSPYSISQALAMTYAGAKGATAEQMAAALHFTLPQQLHPALNALDQTLASRAKGQNPDDQGFQLNIANSLWGQDGFAFQPDFLDLLSENYAAGMRVVDFQNAPEPSRLAINQWVSQETKDKIKDLVPPGAIDNSTRLVLANAIYFKAAWLSPFKKEDTQDKPFYLDSGQTVTVPLMQQSGLHTAYASGDGWQAVEIPYQGAQMSMVVLLPEKGKLSAFENSLDAAKLSAILDGLQPDTINLALPRFKFDASLSLVDTLKGLGMKDAFTDQADFSGMDGKRDLYIGNVLHKAFVSVDEAGTEAAAATAVMMELSTALIGKPVTVTVDHPFLFLIRDRETGAILFLGRVANPQ